MQGAGGRITSDDLAGMQSNLKRAGNSIFNDTMGTVRDRIDVETPKKGWSKIPFTKANKRMGAMKAALQSLSSNSIHSDDSTEPLTFEQMIQELDDVRNTLLELGLDATSVDDSLNELKQQFDEYKGYGRSLLKEQVKEQVKAQVLEDWDNTEKLDHQISSDYDRNISFITWDGAPVNNEDKPKELSKLIKSKYPEEIDVLAQDIVNGVDVSDTRSLLTYLSNNHSGSLFYSILKSTAQTFDAAAVTPISLVGIKGELTFQQGVERLYTFDFDESGPKVTREMGFNIVDPKDEDLSQIGTFTLKIEMTIDRTDNELTSYKTTIDNISASGLPTDLQEKLSELLPSIGFDSQTS